ncbi:MAG: class F sortase [Patescibacteria group bacterium]|jgi:LPXTG-site transpeptidase (sortase) family protein
MQLRAKFRWPSFAINIPGILIFLGIVFFSICLYGWSFYGNSAPPPVSQASQNATGDTPTDNVFGNAFTEQTSPGLPVRLNIPKINIDTTIEQVGLTPDGAVDTPKSQNDAAWFNLGPRPGEKGSAVISGHYGWKDDNPSVFDKLYKLRKGDKLFIEDDKGEITSFVVRENRRYDPDAQARDVFASDDEKSHLNLVTCEGAWDEVSESYSSRLVIFTDRVDK